MCEPVSSRRMRDLSRALPNPARKAVSAYTAVVGLAAVSMARNATRAEFAAKTLAAAECLRNSRRVNVGRSLS